MIRGAILMTVLGLHVCFSEDKHVTDPEFPDSTIYGDINLTKKQYKVFKVAKYVDHNKWPKNNNRVTVPYSFDPRFFHNDNGIRDMFKEAAAHLWAETCIEWIEVLWKDPRHKVMITNSPGRCHSRLGRVENEEQIINLGGKCYGMSAIMHEMGHTMGMPDTHTRSDRDYHIKIWNNSVQNHHSDYFEYKLLSSLGTPYDYKSVMHFGNDYFSINGSFTLTTLDPFAMFAIGSSSGKLRYSDIAYLNKHYDCLADFIELCGERNCQNQGFVGKSCTCRCPENTFGQRCETMHGTLAGELPPCGGIIDTEMEIHPNGYPNRLTSGKCIFTVRAPKCKLPAFTFTQAKFETPDCLHNRLALEVSTVSFGYVWCNYKTIPLGKTIVSETQNANLYFSTMLSGKSGYGFKARVTFTNNPACEPFSKSTVCRLTHASGNSFTFQTDKFPYAVPQGTHCFTVENTTPITELVFLKVKVNYQYIQDDELRISDPMVHQSFGYSRTSDEDGFLYMIYPITITYNARSGKSKGFKITSEPVTDLPGECSGKEVILSEGIRKEVKNPLPTNVPLAHACAFKVTAPKGKRIYIEANFQSVKKDGSLKIAGNLPYNEEYINVPNSMISLGNCIKVYYFTFGQIEDWTLKFSVY